MTEEDRKLNRRVEIFLEPGDTPVPVAQPTDPWGKLQQDIAQAVRELLRELLKDPSRGLPPWIWKPNFPGPLNKDQYTSFKCKILEALKKVDVKTALDFLKDRLLPDDPSEKERTYFIRRIIDEIEQRRREGVDWWKDDDCPQQPPAPAKKSRLLVEPRNVVLKRGGQAVVKVTVVDRPYAGMIQVELRGLPKGVTALRAIYAIYDSPDYIEITLNADPDAPVTKEPSVPSVFADGYYPGVDKLQSDTFTVKVQ